MFRNPAAEIYTDSAHELIYSRWYKGTLDDDWRAASRAVIKTAQDTGYDAYIADAHQGVMLDQAVAKVVVEEVIPQILETNLRIKVFIIPQEFHIEMAIQTAINAFPPPLHASFCHTLTQALQWIEDQRRVLRTSN